MKRDVVYGAPSQSLKQIQRARIVLHSAERLAVLEAARRAGVSRPAVWRCYAFSSVPSSALGVPVG